jgi:hypothetical protein
MNVMMKSSALAVLLVVAATAGSTTASFAQAGTTCADFAKMSEADQTALIASMAPPDTTKSSTNASTTKQDASAPATPMVSAGQVVAACQAAAPTATVHDVLSTAGSVGTTPATTKSN